MTIIRRFNSLLPNYLSQFFGRDYYELSNGYNWYKPAVNVVEEKDDYVLKLAVPGYSKKDFEVKVENDTLKISSKGKEADDNNYTLREFNHYGFERTFHLPETVESDQITASYKDGILYVTLPKKAEAKPKSPKLIEIK